MQTPATIKAVFFDAAGTLFHLPKGVGWHYRDVAARHGCDLQVDSVSRAFRIAWNAALPPPETRCKRSDDDREWWRALVGRVLDECNVRTEFDRDRYFTELYAEFTKPGIWALYPEVAEVLRHLAARFRLGVISNFDGRLHSVLAHLGIRQFFQHCVISSEVGADKPSPWIFRQALKGANIAPGAALHAGDDPVCDWEGAAAAGLQVFRLARPQNNLAEILERLR